MYSTYIEDLEAWSQDFTFYEDIKVRFSETDMYGHMNNTVIFSYFEQARIGLFQKLNIFKIGESTGTSIIVVADLQCDFVRQVYFDEKLKVYAKIAKVGNSSVDVHYMVKNEHNDICFVGRGSIVQINPQTGKSVAFSEETKHILSGKVLQ